MASKTNLGLAPNTGGREIMKAILDNNPIFDERIPVDVRDDLSKIGSTILSDITLQNAWLSDLINRIGLVIIKNRLYENPLREFKKGMLEFGSAIEEIYVDIAKAHEYSICATGEELVEKELGCCKPDVRSMFHELNYKTYYCTDISNENLRQAFLSYAGIENLIAKIVDSLYTGANFDEFLCMKNLIKIAGDNNDFYKVHVPAITDETSGKQAATVMRATTNKLRFPSRAYNAAGVMNTTLPDEAVILINADYEAAMSVEVLAYAFNMEKADLLNRVVIVDDFGGLQNVVALMVDRDWFMVYDVLNNFTEKYIASEMRWKYFYHTWRIFSVSKFENAVLFTTEDIGTDSVTSVTVAPNAVSLPTGASMNLSVDVVTTGNASDKVVWTSANPALVTVDGNGKITVVGVQTAEAQTVVVTATSVFDSTKTGTCTVTIPATA